MVRKWEIYFIGLDPISGSEQGGKRPVLVISNDAVNKNLPIFTCIPFSSLKENEKVYPTEVFLKKEESGLNKDSVLMIHQIRTVSIKRIINSKINEIKNPIIRKRINDAIKEYFEFDDSMFSC